MIVPKRSRVLSVVSYSFINQNRPGGPGLVTPEPLTDWHKLIIVGASKDPHRQTCIGSNGKPMPVAERSNEMSRLPLKRLSPKAPRTFYIVMLSIDWNIFFLIRNQTPRRLPERTHQGADTFLLFWPCPCLQSSLRIWWRALSWLICKLSTIPMQLLTCSPQCSRYLGDNEWSGYTHSSIV